MSRWSRRLLRLVILALVVLAAVAAKDRVGYDPAPYLGDLRALEDSAAGGYANLEWQVQRGVVDPVALHRATDSLIRHATTRSQARHALTAFAAAFKDGHFHATRPTPALITKLEDLVTGRRDGATSIGVGAAKGCAALGYRDDRSPSPLATHTAYRALGPADASFATGVIAAAGRTIGVLRIDAFGVDRFGTVCATAWPEAAREDSSGLCASRCQDRLWIATSDSLLAELRRAIARLETAKATLLLIDLTGNGGGNDWVAAAARQFTATPLRGHFAAVVRHPHHERQLVARLAALRAAREAATDGAWRATLDTALGHAEAQLAAVRARCDRRAIWTKGLAAVGCTQLASEQFTTGFVDYLPPAAHAHAGAGEVFGPAAFVYREGVWRGELALLVDRGTASASEDFVVALHDGAGVPVLGERTWGAGCGYTDGGIGFRLPASGLVVEMPDCARVRRGGENEVSGIEPSMPLTVTADAVVKALTTRRDP